tara:strand:- start:489 stop:812 length:324 start_codon:yes stop_codon:yes gene_type:complete
MIVNNLKTLIFSFLFSLVFISCEEENKYISVEGVIEELEVTSWQYGTHIIYGTEVSGLGNVRYALRSDSYDLSEFMQEPVLVEGYLVKGYPVDGGPQYINVDAIAIP